MSLPIFQHPSLAVLVADSGRFLQGLGARLDPMLPQKAFQDTDRALEWVRQRSPGAWPDALLSANVDTYPRVRQQPAICLDIGNVEQISGDAERFMTPSVLVVDYSMRHMNGVEFCEALRDLPCKKILLIDSADQAIAIDAFNRGLIHRCIQKNSVDSLERLGADIRVLQHEYFKDRSGALRGFLALHEHGFVSDPAVAALIDDLYERHHIVEHYLFANPAGVLLYDGEAMPRLLVIETESSMEAHYEVARDNDAPASLLTALAERQVVPCFYDGDGMYSPAVGESWHKYAQAAQRCRGRQLFYWATFPLSPNAVSKKMISFTSFMREHRVI